MNFENIMPLSTINSEMCRPNTTSSSTIISNPVCKEGEAKLLPIGFAPGPMDVICSRGKSSFKHPGNCYYRNIIKANLPKYSAAKTKADKGIIVSSTLNTIREASSSGIGFVKLMKDGRWYEVEEHVLREKIGQRFRDLLHDQYSSSSKAKQLRRKNREDSKASNISKRKLAAGKNMPSLTNREDVYAPLPIDQAPFYDSNSRRRSFIDVMNTFISDNETKHINGPLNQEERIQPTSLKSSVSLSFEPIPIDLAASMSDFFFDESMPNQESFFSTMTSLWDREEDRLNYRYKQ